MTSGAARRRQYRFLGDDTIQAGSSDSVGATTTSPADRWFPWAVAGITLVALAVRVLYAHNRTGVVAGLGDPYYYHVGANNLLHGHGFTSPFFPHRTVQSGEHPPLYLLYLAIPSAFGMTSPLSHLLWSCVAGAATVGVIGFLGREVVGPRVGIIAASIAAFYPNLWLLDGSVLAETLAVLCTAVALLLSYRAWRRPSVLIFVGIGIACGLAALTRSELILLVPLLLAPLALLAPAPDRRRRLTVLGAGIGAAIIVISPWVVLNLTRFREPEFLSTQSGLLLVSSNCDSVYKGRISYYDSACTEKIRKRLVPDTLDQSEGDVIYRREGLQYIADHKAEALKAVVARIGSIVGLYEPQSQLEIEAFIDLRPFGWARVGLYSFYTLAVLSIAGAVVQRRRRDTPVFPLLVPPVIVIVTVAVGYATTRFRATAEISVVVLAAIAIDAGIREIRSRQLRRRQSVAPGERLELSTS